MAGEGQYDFNSLTMGKGTTYHIRRVTGLDDQPSPRVAIRERAGADGSFTKAEFLSERHIIFEGLIVDKSTMETSIAAVKTAFLIDDSGSTLTWVRGGLSWSVAAKVENGPLFDLTHYVSGVVGFIVGLLAADPEVTEESS